MKVVVDSNIFISGIIFGGTPRKIIELIVEGKVQLFISSDILYEIKIVLERKKFGFSPEITQKIIFEIESLSELVVPKMKRYTILRDVNDNKILDCAIEANVDYIITGDNDLLVLNEYKNIKITTASDFVKNFL